MFRALFLVCAAQTVIGIIVNDQPTGGEYRYSYEIEDPTTGDSKTVEEVRLGQAAVTGRYAVRDPDGAPRTVHYTADPFVGFNAILEQEPTFAPHTNLHEFINFDDQLSLLRNPYFEPQADLHSKPYRRNKYFTPATEMSTEKSPINGLYFEPNKKMNKGPSV